MWQAESKRERRGTVSWHYGIQSQRNRIVSLPISHHVVKWPWTWALQVDRPGYSTYKPCNAEALWMWISSSVNDIFLTELWRLCSTPQLFLSVNYRFPDEKTIVQQGRLKVKCPVKQRVRKSQRYNWNLVQGQGSTRNVDVPHISFLGFSLTPPSALTVKHIYMQHEQVHWRVQTG